MTTQARGKSRRRASEKASDGGEQSQLGGNEMLMQIAELVRRIFGGWKGNILALGVLVVGGLGALAIPAYKVLEVKSAESAPVILPFDSKIVGVTKGFDPHSKTCQHQVINASDQDAYGIEVNPWTITGHSAKGFEATFTSDQSPGLWSASAKTSDDGISVSYQKAGRTPGALRLLKVPGKNYAIGWQLARDCVGSVETMCPYALGVATDLDAMKSDPYIADGKCTVLSLPKQKTVVQ